MPSSNGGRGGHKNKKNGSTTNNIIENVRREKTQNCGHFSCKNRRFARDIYSTSIRASEPQRNCFLAADRVIVGALLWR